jgi:hypothetical protein
MSKMGGNHAQGCKCAVCGANLGATQLGNILKGVGLSALKQVGSVDKATLRQFPQIIYVGTTLASVGALTFEVSPDLARRILPPKWQGDVCQYGPITAGLGVKSDYDPLRRQTTFQQYFIYTVNRRVPGGPTFGAGVNEIVNPLGKGALEGTIFMNIKR